MKIILITGCGSGIGRATAIALANKGYYVYASTHTEKQADELNHLNEKWMLPLFSFKLDITEKEDRNKIKNLNIDILINNAAIGDSGPIAEIDVNKFRATFETNIFSTIELTQEALKYMIKKGRGRIVFTSSLFGCISQPFLSPYCSTKFALEAIGTALNKELKMLKVNIPVILIEPGAFATGFNEKNLQKQFNFLNSTSYYYNYLNKLKVKQFSFFKISESADINKIVNEYIKAVEDINPATRYISPKIQGIFTKTKKIFEK